MKAFTKITAIVAPLDRSNVDTDAIIPKQFLKSIKRSGFGPNAFDEWRYLDHGEPGMDNSKRPLNPDFSLNQPRYQGAQILLTRKNFGCGSSREHAPWALDDYGFRAVIAPEEQVDQLFKEVEANEGYQLSIDLAEQTLTTPSGETFKFDITEHRKHCLLNGLDEIGLTLQHADEIRDFEEKRRQSQPWLFNG